MTWRSLLAYPPDAGSRAHREAAAEWLDRGGHRVTADRIVVCNGSQHGLVALLSMLAREGDVDPRRGCSPTRV